ncbi:serine hydroxymethyltransferase [Bartonella sp. TP]|uniref:serine hydroxymethyltransferase n=1 Tax=Bartonella sp. TP TaxID=3057550 RepID=UPI0025B1F234|nr:serine hydroxymethyltransferase [Bartonella sp. TP]MDN5248779.1 serine hydroxymethyltransferase [Alphaproteobacteria bacterium]WJW80043.1 serine hydroxymethyltransferase [Bartonella sp. TP]
MNLKNISTFFHQALEQKDAAIYSLINKERDRQANEIELIASENLVSQAVLEAQGSILTNKYAEGYPGKRYYGGCHVVDEVESLAIARAKQLFNCGFANVQPNSGSQMNQAVFLALLQPGDKFMGMALDAGGHLTHGSPVNMSGKWFSPISYGVNKDSHLIDMQEVADIARKAKPKLIIAGATAYSRKIDWAGFRKIADEVGAYLMVDMSHIAGLVAGGVLESPLPHAHVVTTTTHKSLRGPRGGLILTNYEDMAKKINSAVFPGMQGGPLMHIIAAKAVSFAEAMAPDFKDYAQKIVANAQILAKTCIDNGINVVTGGTDNHLLLLDLQSYNITGKQLEQTLGSVDIICNKNTVPFDPSSPFITSGIRLGTPASTTRGFGSTEFVAIGEMIASIIKALSTDEELDEALHRVKERVKNLTQNFPIY